MHFSINLEHILIILNLCVLHNSGYSKKKGFEITSSNVNMGKKIFILVKSVRGKMGLTKNWG